MDHINLLLGIGELDWVFKGSNTIEALLQNIVQMVARHMKADVCSIYMYDDVREELVLRATVGLNPDSVGRIRMKPGEGIAGASLKSGEPISTGDAFAHPSFKFFKGTNEELYKSFLAVPIVSGASRTGVLILQSKEQDHFANSDTLALRVIASQLATVIENAKLIMSLGERRQGKQQPGEKPSFDQKFVKGKAASRGYAYGNIAVIDRELSFQGLEPASFTRRYTMADFRKALAKTERQLKVMQKRVESSLSDVASMIFTAHLLMLKDNGFTGAITGLIEKGENPPAAILSVGRKYSAIFSQSQNEHMKEKAQDVEDLAVRLIANLAGNAAGVRGVGGSIVIARDMYPSDILRLSSEKVKGIVLTSGGVTSHVCVLARSLRIPLVIVSEPGLVNLDRGARVLLDAEQGNVYIDPSKDITDEFRDKLRKPPARAKEIKMLPVTETKDGVRVGLLANVNLLKDLELINRLSCDGIGLYRSEFPFIVRKNFPTEEEQYAVYRKLVEGLPGREITFRTLDVGGDKVLPYGQSQHRENPFLGMRSIRFSLKNKDVFIQQVRAILRAGCGADLKIMFPMIYSLDEFDEARSVVSSCIGALRSDGIPCNEHPGIGMMIEVPAVLDILDDLAKAADFFSVGTNDLVQYMLAVDRTNEEVADYYVPHHPAVLRALKKVADAGAKHDVEVSVCGDMAQTAKYIPFLIGIGIRKLSMNPLYLAESQQLIAGIDSKEAQRLAGEVLSTGSIRAIDRLLSGKR